MESRDSFQTMSQEVCLTGEHAHLGEVTSNFGIPISIGVRDFQQCLTRDNGPKFECIPCMVCVKLHMIFCISLILTE